MVNNAKFIKRKWLPTDIDTHIPPLLIQTQTDTDRHRQTQVLSLLNIILSAVWAEHGAGILVIGSAACAEH